MKKRHTILVVDDEPDVVQSVQDLLRLDYKVLGATRAEDGERLMTLHPVDVVMTDQRMPDITGVEFLSQIKVPYPEATRLLFTGYADIRAVIDAINQGNVYRYITKPWDPDELQSIIREACNRHDMIVQRRELLDALHKTNAELQEANVQLSKSDELKTAFIKVASHELRTPLTILNGYAQLALMQSDTTEPTRGWIDRIGQTVKRLSTLVDQIIAMLEQGDFESHLQRQQIELASFCATVAGDVQPFIETRKQSLNRSWASDLGKITADGERLRDSLNQLLLNAIKFTGDGGSISLTASRTLDGGVEFAISDSGCGMDHACLEQYGAAFFTQFDVARHASGTHEHERRGLGLGVSLVRKVAEMHGGRLTAKSSPGTGTTVTLFIPQLSSLPGSLPNSHAKSLPSSPPSSPPNLPAQ